MEYTLKIKDERYFNNGNLILPFLKDEGNHPLGEKIKEWLQSKYDLTELVRKNKHGVKAEALNKALRAKLEIEGAHKETHVLYNGFSHKGKEGFDFSFYDKDYNTACIRNYFVGERGCYNGGKRLDGLGQVVTETGFDGLRREYERDGAGRVTRVNRPGGKWTEYQYDGLDNILKEEQYDGEVSLYTYDKDGMLVKAKNSENLLEFTRDRKTGQVIGEKQGEYTVSRTYDGEGNCTRITSSLGADIRHTYDREGNLQTMQAGEGWQASWVRDNTGLEVQRTFSGGVTVCTERDGFGREVRKSVRSGGIERGAYRYGWGIANRLLSKENELTGMVMRYDYDRFDFLIRQETTQGSETDVIYRVPDFVGNLFGTSDRKDRKYGAGGKLLEDPDCFYHYDDEGNLIFREFKRLQETGVRYDRKRMEKERGIRCLATGTGWLYEWASNGMLKKVIRPDGRPVEFRYDALGRRTAKQYFGKVTRWVWDGNVPIHEWSYKAVGLQSNEAGTLPKELAEYVTTWVFEVGTFVPTAKIQDGKQYSIVSDYLGTPFQMFDEHGNKTWDCTLDVYGKVTSFEGRSLSDCPFRFQGQYEDEETGLYYNRFRFYDSSIGNYISQDPIGLTGNNPTLYAYVKNINNWTDVLGLAPERKVNGISIFGKGQTTGPGHAQLSEEIADKLAMSGEFTEIHLNRSYEAITGISTTPKRSPDVTAIDKYGRVHAIEIASDYDMKTEAKLNELSARNVVAQGQLPPKMQGEVIVIKKPYDADKIKTQMDDLIKKVH